MLKISILLAIVAGCSCAPLVLIPSRTVASFNEVVVPNHHQQLQQRQNQQIQQRSFFFPVQPPRQQQLQQQPPRQQFQQLQQQPPRQQFQQLQQQPGPVPAQGVIREVIEVARLEQQLPPELRNPFYQDPNIAARLAQASQIIPGEIKVSPEDWETNKVPRHAIVNLLKKSGLVP